MTLSSETTGEDIDTLQQVVSIVAAYVSHNAMRAVELPDFISAVHASIRQLSKEPAESESKPPENPAVPVKRSVSKEYIVCLECGKKFKSLRRHLSSFHSLTPDEYRAKWSLPSDYPMVAPAYSATRSQLARESGLGQITRSGEASRTAGDDAFDAHDDVIDGAGGAADAADPAIEPAASASREAAAPPAGGGGGASEAAEAPPAPVEAADEAPKKPKRGRPRKVAA